MENIAHPLLAIHTYSPSEVQPVKGNLEFLQKNRYSKNGIPQDSQIEERFSDLDFNSTVSNNHSNVKDPITQ